MSVMIKSPFWFTFIIVFIVLFLINFISQTYLMKKEDYKISWGSIVVLVFQGIVISIIFEMM
ncbi:hypothetical protein CHH83_22405 [Bacillus sp. 7586-K]|uniref:Membrane-anchored protein n=1 Tax=Metabacillus niabensis TaxID=324854 RepID=A0ABT9Z0R7_9BACI|nr:hypothetical protein [Metabacillus niabensis]MDQ0225837.1 putative membrane-anchored protein [Metabacillus niabensis]PAD66757.1 hypothetical protein CHH83_22405 [Bacillus sp. 7586-K]